MKVLVWLLALSLMVAAFFCKWVAFPISNQLRGFRLSPLGYSSPHALFWSYGALAALLIIVWAIAFQRGSARALCLVGMGLLILALTALMQVAFYDPALLKALASEANQIQMAVAFSSHYLPINPWIEPTRWRFLAFDSLADRVLSGWYFLSFGWYATVAVGAASLTIALRYIDSHLRTRILLLAVSTMIAWAAVLSSSHIRGELALDRGAFEESTGRLRQAVESYRQALRLDGWNQLDPYVYARIGEIDSGSGRKDTFEYRIYHAELLASQNEYPSAIAEYHELAKSSHDHRNWTRLREAVLWTSYGQNLLNGGAAGAAVAAFENALSLDPSNWLAAYCLSRGYFLTARYQQAVDVTMRLLNQSSDPQVRANLYCDLGDAYMRLGESSTAHLAYWHAWGVDQKLARRTLTALVGP